MPHVMPEGNVFSRVHIQPFTPFRIGSFARSTSLESSVGKQAVGT